MKKWFLLILTILPINGYAEEPITADQVLTKVSEFYRNLKNYTLEGMVIREKQSEGTYERREFPFMKSEGVSGESRLEAGWPRKRVLYGTQGEKGWIYNFRTRQYATGNPEEIHNLMEELPGFSELSLVKGYARDYNRIEEVAAETRLLVDELYEWEEGKTPCFVVEFLDSKLSSRPGFLEWFPQRIWVDKSSYAILKEVRRMKFKPAPEELLIEGTETTRLTRLQLNQTVDGSQFSFIPPEGAHDYLEASGASSGFALRPGGEAPDFKLKTVEGKEYSLKKLRGKVILLNFWASWCRPCRIEMPTIEKLYQNYKEKGFLVLGINDEKTDIIRSFGKENSVSFPLLVDDGMVMSDYGIQAIPTLMLVDQEGKISWQQQGTSGEEMLRQALAKVGLK
jgi:peroxiredoxin/outer membrane lipoprotein-sorting protein